MEVVVTTGRAKLQSNRHHQQTNTALYRPDDLPVAQPTVSALKQGLWSVKKSGDQAHPWQARAHNGSLGWSPQRGSRWLSPGWGFRGQSLPAGDEVFVFKTVISNAYATVLHEMMYCLSCFFCKVSK